MSSAVAKAKWLFWACLLALLSGLFACQSVAPVIKIGLVAPFEGSHRAIGYDAIYSARLAVRQLNQAGGVAGYRVALVALDDAGDPDLALEVARSLVVDPQVVAVLGHWLPETTAVAAPIYAEANVAFIPLGQAPFTPLAAAELPADFHQAYEAVTPFDEQAGAYAGPTYDGFQLLWQALAGQPNGRINRTAVAQTLPTVEHSGLTGTVFLPTLP